MAEVTTSMLNFSDKKNKASASQVYRVKIPSSNGTSFNAQQTIDIDLPSNQANSYLDFGSSYISLKLTNNDATTIGLNGQGIYSLIKRIECVTGSQTVFSCDNYNQLVDMLMDQDASPEYKNNTGRTLMGTSPDKYTGFQLATTETKQFCFPLVGNILYNTNKYIPLFSAEKLRLKITLDNANIAVNGTDDALVDTDLLVSQVEFVAYIIKVDQEVQDQINMMTNGVYEIVGDNYSHTGGTMTAGATSANVVTGFSYGSLNRVLIAQNPLVARVGGRCAFTRTQNSTTSASITVNGQKVPQREILDLGASAESNLGSAEVLAEVLVADRSLSSFSHQTSFNSSTAGNDDNNAFTRKGANADSNNDDSDIGTYMISIDTERMRPGASDADKIYSGLNTIGSTVQVALESAGADAGGVNIDCFANYTTRFTLDVSETGSRTWEVQV